MQYYRLPSLVIVIEQRKQVDVKVIHDSNANIHTLLVAVLLYSYQL